MGVCRGPSFLMAVLIGLAGSFGWAAPARIEGQRSESDSSRDVLQTIAARKMLAAEPELAHLNIGVTEKNRVAVLWGPVPSAEASFRAELCLRTMIELAEVRNELFVWEPLEPVQPLLKFNRTPSVAPEQAPPKLPKETRLLPGAPGMLMGKETIERKNATQVKVAPADRPSLPTLGLPLVDQPAETSPGGPTGNDLASAIRGVLQSKTQYGSVQFTVKDGCVYLRTDQQDAGAPQEAAREIARLPGVKGVIVLEKSSSP